MKKEIKKELKEIPGMAVITVDGNTLFNKITRYWTGEGTHTAIYLGKGKRLIGESGYLGNCIRKLGKYLRGKHTVWIYYLPGLTQEQIMLCKDYLYMTLGRRYDWKGILSFVFKGVKQSPNRNFCSEWIIEIYRNANVYIPEGLSPHAFLEYQRQNHWKLVFYMDKKK